MANRRRTSRGGGAGGFKGIVAAGAMILVAIAAVVGWWNYNGFKDLGDAIAWFQTKSANMDKCVNDRLNADNPDAQNILDANGCLIPNITGGGSGTGGAQKGNITLSPDSKTVTLTTLDAIAVKAPADVKYNRSEWKHWLDLDKDGCDTREQILKDNGTDVKTDPKTCKVLSGTWVESYSGKEYTDPSSMDLDHVVPLSWAAANGGNDWDAATKANFANDPSNLMLSDASENRSKGDKGPAEYLPPNTDSQCLYVNTFVFVVSKYNLSMSQLEKSAAQKVIDERC